jgi:hypothetical protein
MRDLNLAFRFILELLVLVALAVWGFSVSNELLIQLALGIGAPAVVIAIWATVVAPRAERRLEDPARLVLEVVVFGAGVLALIAAGHVIPGVFLGLASAISLALMLVWGQRGH